MTTSCYFKGRSTRRLLSWVLISFYIGLAALEGCWMVANISSWKCFYQLLKHLPIHCEPGSVSDLYLLMALIKLNRGHRKVVNPFRRLSIEMHFIDFMSCIFRRYP